jgi:hypothetical protein
VNTHVCQPVVLAAGLGTRLGSLTKYFPKAVVPTNTGPLCLDTLKQIQACGFLDCFLNSYHLSEILEEQLNQAKLNLSLKIFKEKERLETGGGLIEIAKSCSKPFLLILSADIKADWKLKSFIEKGLSSFLKHPHQKVFLKVFSDQKSERSLFLHSKGGLSLKPTNQGSVTFANLQLIKTDFLKKLSTKFGSYRSLILENMKPQEIGFDLDEQIQNWKNLSFPKDLNSYLTKTLPHLPEKSVVSWIDSFDLKKRNLFNAPFYASKAWKQNALEQARSYKKMNLPLEQILKSSKYLFYSSNHEFYIQDKNFGFLF